MLNDMQIKALKATGKRYEVSFKDGLYLDVTASGVKTWRYRYRLQGQREKIIIGPYPAIGLKQANAKHLEYAAMVANKASPARELERDKQLAGEARTVEELAKLYRIDLSQRSKNPDGGRGWLFDAYIIPKIGRYPLADIVQTDVLHFLDAIKTNAPASALAVHGTLKRMFDFAIGCELMTVNPAAEIPARAIAENSHAADYYRPRKSGRYCADSMTAKASQPRSMPSAYSFSPWSGARNYCKRFGMNSTWRMRYGRFPANEARTASHTLSRFPAMPSQS